MTISASSSFDLSRTEIMTASLRLVGRASMGIVDQAQVSSDEAAASVFLDMRLKTLQARGLIQRTVDLTTNTLTAGTSSYPLASTVMSVKAPPVMLIDTDGVSETELLVISEQDWLRITDKTVQGPPTRVFVKYGTVVTLYVDPVPDAAYTLRYAQVHVIADMDSGSVTPELHAEFLQMLVYGVAHDLALSFGDTLARVQYLGEMAEKAEKAALGGDTPAGDLQFFLGG